MRTLFRSLAALVMAMSLGLAAAPAALGKAHDQGSTDKPGEKVGTETVGPAQGLGKDSSGGKGKGPGDTPAGDSPGNSGDAGR